MSIITWKFRAGQTPYQIRMDLDGGRPNEKAILDFMKSGNFYEPDEANVMLTVLREDDTVIDIGANVGFFTVLAATLVGRKGRIVAFEPAAECMARLRSNLALNDLGNVSLVQRVATNQVGEVTFFLNSDNSGGNALWDPGQWPTNEKSRANPMHVSVSGTTVDAECERLRLPTPKLIKVDTEGAEQRVLEGAHNLLAGRKVPFVIAELHEFGLAKMGCTQDSLRGLMEGLGYSTFGLSYNGALPKLVPPGTRIKYPFIINLLFSTPEKVGEYWPIVVIDPRDPR